MKYNEKYGYKHQYRAPPDKEIEPGVWESTRLYACAYCKVKTVYRIDMGPGNPGVPCCSEECKKVATDDSREIELASKNGPPVLPDDSFPKSASKGKADR